MTGRGWRYRDISPDAFRREQDFPPRIRFLRWLGRQTWLPRGQDALLRATFDPDGGEHFYFEVDFFGRRYRGDLGHYLDWLVFCYGGAPLNELMLLKDLTTFLRRERHGAQVSFYDVGANIGHHSLFMSSLADNVLAFEPFSDLVRLIEEKITLNGIDNIRIVPVALGDADGSFDYFPGLGANPGAGSLLKSFPGVSAESVSVDVRNGDRLFATEDFPPIDILKLDVQGYEPRVLRGLQRRLATDMPIVLSEMTDEARAEFGDEAGFRRFFYDGALFAEVTGRNGRSYRLEPFNYRASQEMLVLPAGFARFLEGRM